MFGCGSVGSQGFFIHGEPEQRPTDTLLQVADLQPPCRTARITTQKVRSAEYLDRVSYCVQLAFMSYVSVPEKKN